MREPPKFIEILLPVWGAVYTRDFLDLSLPSLLAPRNLPAVAGLGPCTFVLLAPQKDADTIQASSLWSLVLGICSVRVVHTDELISHSSSTVLTLAYTLAIRSAGERSLDTCFVPLVADYIMADGSLLAAIAPIFAGARSVLAGNFQIQRELASSRLQNWKSRSGVLAITPRSLIDISFNALHSSTVDRIVTENGDITPAANRLFWRVNKECMVGRFFLMHMIAIHPERLDFVIAAPSDYSLVPELCPSGQVVRMTDSDEYFVVECQPRGEALEPTVRHRDNTRSFAKALETWATSMHWDNARHALIFHTEALPRCLSEKIAASEAFVRGVEAHREKLPQPFRYHPDWRRSLDYHIATAQQEQHPARLAWITGDKTLMKGPQTLGRLRAILLGRAPDFRPWHPRWPDVRMLRLRLTAATGDVAFVSDAPARVRNWLERLAWKQGVRSVVHFRISDIQNLAGMGNERPKTCFDSVFLIGDNTSEETAQVLKELRLYIKPNGVVVLGFGDLFTETKYGTGAVTMAIEDAFIHSEFSVQRISCVAGGVLRGAVQATMMEYARRAVRGRGPRVLLWLAVAGGLAAISMVVNSVSGRDLNARKHLRLSSLFFTLRRVRT